MADVIEGDKVTVKQVCQDFRVREDGVLASKLQEEEFQKHYVRNKSERKTVRGDVRVAKQTYLEEVKTAQLLPEQELEQLSMEETDKWLARDLQDKLHSEERKEIERQRRLAQQDAKVAKSMQERERERLERARHRRREERREEERLGREQQEQEQRQLEQQDSEEVDEQTAIELRDARLARELQERERELYERERQRYRQERERAKQRYEREQKRERERERMDGQENEQDHERHHHERERRERERRDGHEAERAHDSQRRERDPRNEHEVNRIDDHEDERERERERQRHLHEREQRRAMERERAREREIREREAREREAMERDARERDAREGEARERERGRLDDQERERHHHEREQRRERPEDQEMDSQRERELRDARLARELQEEEKRRFDIEWQRQREMEEHERRSYRRSTSAPNERERDSRRTTSRPPHDPITMNGHGEPATHRQTRPGSGREDRREKRQSSDSNSSGSSTGEERRPRDIRQPPRDIRKSPKEHRRSPKEDRKSKDDRRREGEIAVVPVPSSENGGGRIEGNKIIMADGTEIKLFDDEEDKHKPVKDNHKNVTDKNKPVHDQHKEVEQERLKKDEEYAKMLQDQERRISEAERIAAEDRRLAMEEQDRELARQLQRKEYHRMQQEKKERQMRRANSMPADRHSVNLEDPRRLPSYAESLNRHQLPDLLPGNDPSSNRYSYVSTHSGGSHGNSLERDTYNQVEREKHTAPERTRDDLQPRGAVDSGYSQLRTRGIEDCDHLPSRESEHLRTRGAPVARGIDHPDYIRSHDNDDAVEVVLPDHDRYLSGERISSRGRHEPERVPPEDRHSPHDFPSTVNNQDDLKKRDYPKYADDQLVDRQSPVDDRHPVDQGERRPFPIIANFENSEDDEVGNNQPLTKVEYSPVWKTREPQQESPSSSLERHRENAAKDPSQARHSYASSGGNSTDRRSQNSGSSPPRDGVWERFDDDDDEFSVATGRSSRQMFRSQTHPISKDSERSVYNVVEGIDPTFRRKKKSIEDDGTENNTEERTRFMPLIKPQRRRSTDKKKSKDKKK